MSEAASTLATARPAPAGTPEERAGISVFPRFVCRVAGLPVGVLDEQRAARTTAGLDHAAALAAALDATRAELGDRLHAAIGGLEDRELRNRLLQLRRDVHNRRPLDAGRLAAARPALGDELWRDLDRHQRRDRRRRLLLERLAATYRAEVAAARRRLQAAIDDPDFRDALLLSSRDLSAGLERYRRAPADRLGAKERQLERGLLRYLSRMAIKTSPFATFTALLPGRLEDDPGGGGLRFAGDPRRKRTVVRLNKRIYAVLREELVADPETRVHLPVELNPTLHAEGAQWRFLAGLGDREVFQRVPRGPVLELFRDALAGGPLPQLELERRVAARPEIEAAPEEVAAYTARLLEIGFLRFNLGVGEQEADWDRPLAGLLEPVRSETAARVLRLLGRLRAGREAYESASLDDRRRLLDETTAAMHATSARLAERTTFRADVPFYVDAAADAWLPVPGAELAPAFDELGTWTRLTARLAWPREEQAEMRGFFDRFYGEGPVPLLRFYEDYYREHFKDHLERLRRSPHARAAAAGEQGEDEGDGEAGAEPAAGDPAQAGPETGRFNPFGLELVAAMKDARDRLRALIDERWRSAPQAEEMTIAEADLEAVVADLPEPAAPCHSASTFVQLLPGFGRGGGAALLAGHLLGGFGKYFSRFLHVLPEELRDDLRAHNDALTGEILAEISADGAFNANLHPPLLRWEVSYPTGDRAGLQRPILVSDLRVEAYPDDPHALGLRHAPTGRRVVALDLGFQNPQLRPPLFQLLSRFAPAVSFGLDLWERPRSDGEEDDPAPRILHRPRLRFGDHLVLARRRWSVPSELYPRRTAGETDFDFMLRADAWRREHGIPRETFLSVYPQPVPRPAPEAAAADGAAADGATPAEPAAAAPPRRREHPNKPQYIDFANPLLVDLLGRAVEGLGAFVANFYERLPAAEHLPAAGADRYAAELVAQIDLRRRPAAGSGEGEEAGVGG